MFRVNSSCCWRLNQRHVFQASNSVVALYDNISQYTLSRKRKSEALDADDAFFMNIEKELNRKKKRIGGDKNLSRTLHSLRFITYLAFGKYACLADFFRLRAFYFTYN